MRFLAPFLTLTLGCALYACGGDDAQIDESDSGPGTTDAGRDSGKSDATTPTDGSVRDATGDTATANDTGAADAADAADAATTDARVTDAATADAATRDAGDASATSFRVWVLRVGDVARVTDGGTDSGAIDAGDVDAGDLDASVDDAGDAGTDAGTDAGPTIPTLTNASTQGYLEEYAVAGGATAPLRSIALPTTASGTNQPITFAGSSSTEGSLTLSVDGRFVTLAGYATAPGLAKVSSFPSDTADAAPTVARVVARVDKNGVVDTSTVLKGAFSGTSVRSAASTDGSEFWVGGAASTGTASVQYVAFQGTGASANVLSSPSTLRGVGIFQNQLYISSQSGGFNGISAVGTGLPKTTVSLATLVAGSGTIKYSPYGFVALDTDATPGADVIYVADDSAAVPLDGGVVAGGIQKWTLQSSVWSLAATFQVSPTTSPRGLAAFVDGTVVTLVAATTDNKLVYCVDNGTALPQFTTIAELPPGNATAFRGVAPAPR